MSTSEAKSGSSASASEHIYGEPYKARLREKFMEAMSNCQDLSVDADGNLMLIETKLIFQRLAWNPETNSFEKAYSSRGRAKKSLSSRRYSKGRVDYVDPADLDSGQDRMKEEV